MNQQEFDKLIMSSPQLRQLLTEINGTYGRALAILAGAIAETAADPKALQLHLQAALSAGSQISGDPLLPDLLQPSIELLKRKQQTNEEQAETTAN